MGNIIPTNNISDWWQTVKDPPGINPGPNATPTFDPMFGFENGRKERGKHRNDLLWSCYKILIITPITSMLKSVIMLFFVTVMVATKEEMDAANLAYSERGFCAHFKIELNSCYEREKPFDYRCSHEKHAYLNCQYEE